jgi:hypothetical protein
VLPSGHSRKLPDPDEDSINTEGVVDESLS